MPRRFLFPTTIATVTCVACVLTACDKKEPPPPPPASSAKVDSTALATPPSATAAPSTSAAAAPADSAPKVAPTGPFTIAKKFQAGATYELSLQRKMSLGDTTVSATYVIDSVESDGTSQGTLRIHEVKDMGRVRASEVSVKMKSTPNDHGRDYDVTLGPGGASVELYETTFEEMAGDSCDPPDGAHSLGQKWEVKKGDSKDVWAIEKKADVQPDGVYVTYTHDVVASGAKAPSFTMKARARVRLDDGYTGTCHEQKTITAIPGEQTYDFTTQRSK
jgi:hypothetical protein